MSFSELTPWNSVASTAEGGPLVTASARAQTIDSELTETLEMSSSNRMNKQLRLVLVPLCYGLAFPVRCLAAEEQARSHSAAVDLLYAILPFLMLGALLWWFLRRSQRSSSPFMRRSMEYYERSEQHMQRIEQIGERIAAALEKLNERSSEDGTNR